MSKKRIKWPKNCIWPAPLTEYDWSAWDEDLIPDEIDDETEELVEIKEYFDSLIDEGKLDEEYRLTDEEEVDVWEPDMGEDYWNGEQFDIEAWREDLCTSLNALKIDIVDVKNDPTIAISQVIHYQFINENLLRQAFTRRTFQVEYRLSGSNEELEFIGDSALSIVVTRELIEQFASTDKYETDAPFHSSLNEGEYSLIKSYFVCKEHLAERCRQLGLDKYILFGTGEEPTDSALEDAMEALIGAVAMDCGWDMTILTDVVDRLINLQFEKVDRYLKKSYYEIFNSWHQKHFGCLPEYEVYCNQNRWNATIRFFVPENEKGIHTAQRIDYDGETRSAARNLVAELARDFVIENGLWINIKDADVVPELENSINQLQQMSQQKYIEDLNYDIQLITYRDKKVWECAASANGQYAVGTHASKVMAKKKAAFSLLVKILKGAGISNPEWDEQVWHLYIPENPKTPEASKQVSGGLKYTAVVEILKRIPTGKVITEKVLVEHLEKYYGIENLIINYAEFPRVGLRDEEVPFHRYLTAKGLIDAAYKEKAEAEGHKIAETKTTNYRVLDYKETMADLSKIKMPSKEDAIGPCGSFTDNVSADRKEALYNANLR